MSIETKARKMLRNQVMPSQIAAELGIPKERFKEVFAPFLDDSLSFLEKSRKLRSWRIRVPAAAEILGVTLEEYRRRIGPMRGVGQPGARKKKSERDAEVDRIAKILGVRRRVASKFVKKST